MFRPVSNGLAGSVLLLGYTLEVRVSTCLPNSGSVSIAVAAAALSRAVGTAERKLPRFQLLCDQLQKEGRSR